MKKRLSLLLIATFTVATTYGQSSIDVLQAQYNNDITALLNYCNSRDKNIADEAYKALYVYSDLTDLSLNDIVKYHDLTKYNPTLRPLFDEKYEDVKQNLYAKYKYKTVKDVINEANYYPEKRELVNEFLKTNIGDHLDELSYDELTYLRHEVPGYMSYAVQSERDGRTVEKQMIAKSNANHYCDLEKEHIDNLYYVFEKSVMEYLYLNYGKVIVAYANTALPETTDEMESQYKSLVKAEVSDAKFKSFMQNELDKFCAEINKARSSYAHQCGKSNYVKLALKMPDVKLSNYSVSTESLLKIVDERKSYKENTKTADWIATGASVVASFFDGGFLSNALITGAKHLVTSSLADDMAENVLEARKEYLSKVLKSLEENTENQFSTVENSLKQQLSDNEIQFRNDLEK